MARTVLPQELEAASPSDAATENPKIDNSLILRTVVVVPMGQQQAIPCFTYALSPVHAERSNVPREMKDNSTVDETQSLPTSSFAPSESYKKELLLACKALKLPGLYRTVIESYASIDLCRKLNRIKKSNVSYRESDETANSSSNPDISRIKHLLKCLQSARDSAASRAVEVARRDALFDDPLAAVSAGPDAVRMAISNLPPSDDARFRQHHLRTRYIDDSLKDFVKKNRNLRNGKVNVVVLGAGFDARGIRLSRYISEKRDTENVPSGGNKAFKIEYFEIDLMEVNLIKRAIMANMCPDEEKFVRTVAADIRSSHWTKKLFEEAFDANVKTLWICESVFASFSADDVKKILKEIRRLSCPGSQLVSTVTKKLSFFSGAQTAIRISKEDLIREMHLKLPNIKSNTRQEQKECLQAALEEILNKNRGNKMREEKKNFWECPNAPEFFRDCGWQVVFEAIHPGKVHPKGIAYLRDPGLSIEPRTSPNTYVLLAENIDGAKKS
eukprot:CAMPEP_0184499478 /NCGR_PEP_ID=MMETSP0113_2-20130426/41596_1 /TAXON_ID=91329 /ORGANISM="Norrisiella sphaerica, Strain BC52" /LENGTH=499 /DNA_ID=CAMNT_0026887395 /DNA_START=104 /DNA_END=1603 /DNA_ORIENTATION=-